MSVDRLLTLLDLERIERDLFRGPNPGRGERLFGGQVASQALRAAQLTVEPDQRVHSLHSYFLRPGRYGSPILLRVDRIRDGRSFSTRRVVAIQRGEAIFNLEASFHRDEPGPAFQLPRRRDVPDPESLPRGHLWMAHHTPIDSREVDVPVGPEAPPVRRVWFRTDGRLPDDPALHACAVTFASDMGPMGAVRRAYGGAAVRPGPMRGMGASLDHVLWFHRPFRADDWLLYDLEAVAAGGARGLARGTVHTRAGELCVSVTQEVLLRLPTADEDGR